MLTRHSFWTRLVCLATTVAATASVMAADTARLASFRQDGQTSFALSLTAEMPSKEVDAVDVIVLFDTSASQQGAYRETAIESLKALLAGLRPSDRVQVVAVDLNARPLTEDFASTQDPAIAEALSALGQQAPLGTTDLGGALNAAVDQFEKAESGNRAIIYIGDGISMANLLDAPTLGPIVAKLQAARVPVNSYAVGPETDPQLLAVLANQTGGNVYVGEAMVWQDDAGVTDARAREENARNAAVAGKALANWSRASVLWAAKAQIPNVLGQVYPSNFPPLRADRDTILVGRTPAELTAPIALQVQAAGADGKPVELAWDAKPEAGGPDHAFLVSLVDGASRDGGLTLPTVGMAGLAEVARLKGAQADQLTVLAQRAIASGDRTGALRIVQTVLQTDPGNVQARTVQSALQGAADLPPAGSQAAAVSPPVVAQPLAEPIAVPTDGAIILSKAPAPVPLPPAEPGLLERRGPDGAFLDEVEQERFVFQRVMETEVQNTVRNARERMANEPQIAIQDLKLAMENVSRAANLDPAKRAELEDKLRIALREATRQAGLKDELDRLRDEELAAAREATYLNRQLEQRIGRIQQLMDRFNALMDERRYVEAEEVAAIVEELDPNGVTPRVASLWARHKRHDYLQQVARSARHNAAWDTMYQIELSHIPFPDNPPIVYPDASVWEELSKRRKGVYAVDLASEGEAERRIYSALRQPLREPLDFVEQPLRDVVTILSETYDIPIQFDNAALDAVAASPDVEVSIQISNVSLKSALELMLKNAGAEALTYIVDNEVLLITTQEEAETRLQVKVYPVADLVLPIQPIGMMGGGGGMMGGGGGGGGGGMGGGMGGGGGGMMGGGGGGGMFAVPDDVTAEVPKPADASDATPAAPAASAPAATSGESPVAPTSTSAPRVTGIEIDLSMAPEAFWLKHFAGKQEDLAVVRRAVKQLIKQQHYDHAISLIQAALANGQPQSWMYESLGIALELAGRPKSEIERAIMSACDFSTSPEELMLIARYLSHIGLDARAVDVYQQVVKAAPLYHEAYSLGLRAAQRSKENDGIRWATAGILKQAWPADQQAIRNTALRIAQATLEEMRAAGENEAADAFQIDLDAALVRDCVVKVSWSGDADVDLIVEEPSGTTCSLREPRSAGGGVVLGDAYANYEKEEAKADGFSETYVCPQGFPGEYRVRVRKVWGDVVADRVTVDVYKNYRSKEEKHERQYVPVGEDDSLVVFNLDQGRRNDPIEAQQLVASVSRQQAISQAVMAQQVGSLDDPSILPGRSNLDPLDLRRQLALARGGAVGFMPVVISLPEGTSLIASAVVSADRRYVRISAAPSFTGIGNVTTFTFAGSAAQTPGGGGTGGGGTGGGGGGTGGGTGF